MFETFVGEFTREWNRHQAETSGDIAARKSEIARVNAQLERLVDAWSQAHRSARSRTGWRALRDGALNSRPNLATSSMPAPQLHPNLAVVYREKATSLTDALAGADSAKLRNLVRALVDEIRLVPEDGSLRIELRGELVAILGLGYAGNGKHPGGEAEMLAMQVSVVAGTRNYLDLLLTG